MNSYANSYEVSNYSSAEAALYLRLKPQDVRRWLQEGLVRPQSGGVSFLNLLELHILKCLRKEFALPLQRIRRALDEYNQTENSDHPFLDPRMETDGIHLFLHDGGEYMNLNWAFLKYSLLI
jgi:DNA-binding transcriptional MerR regulator